MSKVYYSDETLLNKKVKLTGYFDNIVAALKEVNDINVSDNWKCIKGTELSNTFNDLKGKIDSINKAINSYESFLVTTDSTYRDINSSISDVLSNYINNS